MFKIQINETEYRVKFRHNIPDQYDYLEYGKEPFKYTFGTECAILETLEEDYKLVGLGNTHLSPKDQYNRDVGRKLSLARALKDAVFNKDIRILFWDKYFEAKETKNG